MINNNYEEIIENINVKNDIKSLKIIIGINIKT